MTQKPRADGAGETPLDRLARLGERAREELKRRWVTSVEQFVALCGNEQAREKVAEALGMDEEGLKQVLGEAERVLGPERAAELRRPAAERPRGCLLTEEQRKRFGIP